MAKEIKEERISRKDGKDCFVEMLDSAFPIDKFQLDFIHYDTNAEKGKRQTANIRIYLDGEDFLGLAKKVENKGEIYTKYCNDHPEFKKPLFERMGGTSAKTLKFRGKERGDKMSESRVFTISASKKGYFLTAKSGPGEESEKGLIVPRYKDPEQKVSIALDHDTLVGALEVGKARYYAHLTAKEVAKELLNQGFAEEVAKVLMGLLSGGETANTATQQKKQTNTQTATANSKPSKPVEAKPATAESFDVTDDDLPF